MALSSRNGVKGGPPRAPGTVQDAREREEAERQDRHRTEELLDECGEIEEELERLKGRFELYFLGVERREPAREREELRRRVARLKGEFTRNTGLRFRIETLHARFLSYDRMWTRGARQKEDGTYRRDIMRARRREDLQRAAEAREAKRSQPSAAGSPRATAPPDVAGSASPPPPSPAVPGATPAPPRGGPAGAPGPAPAVSQEQLRALYDAYLDAKRRCHEDVSRLSFEALARAVEKQVPELVAKYRARSVEFKVVVKDGRAVLKAVPKV